MAAVGVARSSFRLIASAAVAAVTLSAGGAARASVQPIDILTAYGFAGTVRSTYQGAGQTIAVYASTSATYVGLQSDLDTFSSKYITGGTSATISYKYIDEANGAVTASGRTPTSTTGDAELAMDVQYAHCLAPKANIVVVSGDSVSGAAWGAATKLGASVFTTSIASYESSTSASDISAANSKYKKADTAGAALFAAVGDSSHYDYPASSPYVIGVGGTNLYTDDTTHARTSEISWSDGGGGQSAYLNEPAWQYAVQQTGYKQGPDVSIAGGVASAVPVYINGVVSYHYGSSLASPLWAGLAALIQEARADAGLDTLSTSELMTALYGAYPNAATYAKLFYDVKTTGAGGTLTAGPGFDMVTGLGTPRVPAMISYLVPEPASLGLLAGTVGLLVRRTRRRA